LPGGFTVTAPNLSGTYAAIDDGPDGLNSISDDPDPFPNGVEFYDSGYNPNTDTGTSEFTTPAHPYGTPNYVLDGLLGNLDVKQASVDISDIGIDACGYTGGGLPVDIYTPDFDSAPTATVTSGCGLIDFEDQLSKCSDLIADENAEDNDPDSLYIDQDMLWNGECVGYIPPQDTSGPEPTCPADLCGPNAFGRRLPSPARVAATRPRRHALFPAAPGEARGLDVASAGTTSFTFTGQTAPPEIALYGPQGLIPATGQPSATGLRAFFSTDTALKSTVVVVPNAPAGRYAAIVRSGSSPLTVMAETRPVSASAIKVSVSAVRGSRQRILRYRGPVAPGQAIVFKEQSAGAAATIGIARAANGRIRFLPAAGPAGRRTILADLLRDGHPFSEVTVGSYSAPGPALLPAPRRLRITAHGNSAHVTFRPVGRARAYLVRVTVSDGRRYEKTLAVPSLRVSTVSPGGTVRVTVTAIDQTGRQGRTAKAKVRIGHKLGFCEFRRPGHCK
jgi:hypothetical protein